MIIICTFVVVVVVLSSILLILTLDGHYLLNFLGGILTKFNPKQPVYNTDLYWCKTLCNNYKRIQQEYLEYTTNNSLKRFADIDSIQQDLDTGDIPWQVVILRVYNKNTPNMDKFSLTRQLLQNVPGCTFAMFSVLHPGKILEPHQGPYCGVLRYHLSIITPRDSDKCYLQIHNQKLHWIQGEDLMFDDTYKHGAYNLSDESRVVLFLDIKREYNNVFIDWFNSTFLYLAQYNNSVQEIVNNS